MLCCLCLSSCENKDYYKIDMNTDYKDTLNLDYGNGNKTKVVLFLGRVMLRVVHIMIIYKKIFLKKNIKNAKMVLKMF